MDSTQKDSGIAESSLRDLAALADHADADLDWPTASWDIVRAAKGSPLHPADRSPQKIYLETPEAR